MDEECGERGGGRQAWMWVGAKLRLIIFIFIIIFIAGSRLSPSCNRR
jgi:hypothetical protein